MRPSIPNSNAVNTAFRSLEKRLLIARKKINVAAAAQMKENEYDAAKSWMEVGSSVADFAERVAAFSEEWKRLVKATRIAVHADKNHTSGGKTGPATGPKRTPAWKFCVPALKAVVSRGGVADMTQVLTDLDVALAASLTEKDRSRDVKRDSPKWHSAVQRAYRQSQREGWVEKNRDGLWKVTQRGKSVAAEES